METMKFDTDDFTFKDGILTLKEHMSVFPRELIVHSNHTGRKITFIHDDAAAERNEFWDGLLAEYIPLERCNVTKLVIRAE